ncbi:TspO/MBR-like protein [Fragilaria crotonensis]|nr:TspO/MBR-like protein [Fragilaria crotonensis]
MVESKFLITLALLLGGTSGAIAFAPGQPRVHAKVVSVRSQSPALALTSSPVAWAAGHAVGGALGAPVVSQAKSWYKKIDLPPWTPPDFLFGPVWTILYSAMGVAAARVYQRTQSLTSTPMVLWMIHYLALNGLQSFRNETSPNGYDSKLVDDDIVADHHSVVLSK